MKKVKEIKVHVPNFFYGSIEVGEDVVEYYFDTGFYITQNPIRVIELFDTAVNKYVQKKSEFEGSFKNPQIHL